MKKISLMVFLGLTLISSVIWANGDCAGVLPQVSLQLSAERWVTTHTAKVSVALDASLNKDQLAHAQKNFQAALKQIAPEGDWHITEFSQNPSKANLEQLHAVAQARLSDAGIAGIRERAGKQSSEGQTYNVQDIVYSPSTAEISAVQADLRADIYNQAKAELDRLNNVYPKAGYTIYNINFTNLSQPGPMMSKLSNEMVAMVNESPGIFLSQQMTQQAQIIFAAAPGSLCQKS